jgi:hypothetical protein
LPGFESHHIGIETFTMISTFFALSMFELHHIGIETSLA